MKKIILLACVSCALHFSLIAQFSPGAKDSAQLEIRQRTYEWNQSIIHRDSVLLDHLLANEYSLNGIVNRQAWMNNTLHHIVTDTLQVIHEGNFSFYGSAAKMENDFFWKASVDGNPRIHAEYAVTDIWVKRDGRWQVLIRMSALSRMR
jgi:hypothetical protein